ncbi:2-dehydropantoate 2-reductase [Paucibacter sp. DJ2R-2]|uniref:2-dehydropantoate 2-reductase n=1 Tax=Paucibacter sp. DJ2R-2 TaxID=2893558 RepID=UPI0021E4F9D7|nr:2-dehydropantoate 2-reductase [Paucibacter sp. DJ2R-2]MCV2422484.1 2-dehydropantoate 2-reductase [Paucibacter sp. DJ4R-1]MCV2440364.1 2-dehydropantoate 2-reductase [Paucibacter sp. DJ2R-2]
MKFAIVGAGAIGGLLGVRLAVAGEQVCFIARNKNLAAIQAQGFTLIEEDGRELTQPAGPNLHAVQRMAEAGVQDVVLLTVKAHQLVDLLPELPALIGPQTLIVSMINGLPWWYFQGLAGPHEGRVLESVDPGGAIAATLPAAQVIGSIVYPAAQLEAPGRVRLIEGNRFSLGELDGQRSERIEALSQALMRAGFKAPVAKDIRSELWVKLWGNLSFNPISALSHATLEDICRFPLSRELAARMMGEAQQVGEKLGVQFKISLDKRIAGAEAVGAHKTSMLQDVEAGRALELEALLGAVVELARITETVTPNLDAIYAVTRLLALSLGRQGGRLQISPA